LPSSKLLDRLDDVVKNCERIERHIAGMPHEAYFADEKTIDAVERCLQRISEAAYKLGAYLDDLYPDAPWKQARGIGNILRRKYDEIAEDLIWASIEDDVPRLRRCALAEIERLKAEDAESQKRE
jgi:uncharacterized protein with HEPN domain